jgi:hypothetical protein
MNAPTRTPQQWLCPIARPVITLRADSARPLPAWITRHLEACPRCAAFHRAQLVLAGALTARTPQTTEAPAYLASRVLARIEQPATAPRRLHPALLPALAVIVLLAVAVQFLPTSPQPDSFVAASPSVAAHNAISPALVAPLDTTPHLPTTLEKELKRLVADATNALAGITALLSP